MMTIKKFILGEKVTSEYQSTGKTKNPYTKGAEGREEWNDRYFNMTKQIRRWQLAFFSSISAVFIMVIIIGKIATESHVQPFAVETNNGMPYAIKPMMPMNYQDNKIINYALDQFIINSRSIIHDTEAEKTLLNKAYAFSADNTISYLRDYYKINNPFDLASQYSVTVSIVNSLPISKDSWQIMWDETKRSITGNNILEVTHWMANVTFKFSEVNPNFISDNPFGIYITDLSWSQSQTQKLGN